MKERPILFGAAMVRAILAGEKTQTRRVVKFKDRDGKRALLPLRIGGQGHGYLIDTGSGVSDGAPLGGYLDIVNRCKEKGWSPWCPHGGRGDRLWVRENGWERPERTQRQMRDGADTWAPYYYDADGIDENDADDFKRWGFKRRPSIHMPRWASRITLGITNLRVHRLHDTSSDDIVAEGVRIPVCQESGNALIDISTSNGPGAFLHSREQYRDSDALLRAHWAALWCAINGRASWDANPWVWAITFQRVTP